MYGWYSDNSVFLEDSGVYLRPGVYSVVVLEESPCPRDPREPIFKSLSLSLSSSSEVQVLENFRGLSRLSVSALRVGISAGVAMT